MIMQDFFKNVGREKVGGAEMEVTDNDFLRKIRMEKTLTRILARVSVNVCFGKVLCEEFCGFRSHPWTNTAAMPKSDFRVALH